MQCFPVKSLVHKVLGGGGVYAYMRYVATGAASAACFSAQHEARPEMCLAYNGQEEEGNIQNFIHG
jgi:hypothetical protein